MRPALVLTVVVAFAVACATAQHIPTTPPLPSPSVQQIVQMQRPTVSLHLPLRNGQSRACTLTQRAGDNVGVVTSMTSDGARTWSASERWVTYRGTTEDGGVAIVTFHTSGELRATILYADSARTIASLADRPLNPSYGMQMMSVGAFTCATPEAEPTSSVVRALANVHKLPEMQQQLDTITVRCAVEVDYDMVEAIRSVAGTETYVANVLAVMSTVYEREVRAKLVLSNLRVWDNANDPYPTEESVFTLLDIFVDEYEKNMTQVPRDLAMFLTMRGGQGGIARTIGGLCESGNSYCAGDVLQTIANYPTWSWDVGMLTHEIGHLAGAIHTQSCFWPGGPLDSCVASESGTCVDYDDVRPTRGTIMSYCHQLLDQGATMALEFHPLHRRVVRSFLERATCLGNMPLPTINRVRGVVRNAETGKVIPGLSLEIRPVETTIYRRMPVINGTTTTQTDAEGRYGFAGLGAGLYEIVVKGPYASDIANQSRRNAVMVVDSVVTYDLTLTNVLAVDIRFTGIDSLPLVLSIFSDSLPVQMRNLIISNGRPDDTASTKSLLLTFKRGTYHIIPSAEGARFTPPEIILNVEPPATEAIPTIAAFTCTERGLPTSNYVLAYARMREARTNAPSILTGQRPYTVRDESTQKIVRTGTSDADGVTRVTDLPSSVAYTFAFDGDTAVYAPYGEASWLSSQYGLFSGLIIDVPRRMPVLARNYQMKVVDQVYTELITPTIAFDQSVRGVQPVTIDLPFTVRCADRALTTLTIYQNGYCSLGGSELGRWVSRPIAERTIVDLIAAPFANEYVPDTNAPNPWRVAVAFLGDAPRRRAVIEWRNLALRQWDNSQGAMVSFGRFRFQLHVYEDGMIDMVYDAPEALDGSTPVYAQVGLRGSDVLDNSLLSPQSDDNLRDVSQVYDRSGTAQVVLSTAAGMKSGLTYRWTLHSTQVQRDEEAAVTVLPNPASEVLYVTSAPVGATITLVDNLGVAVRSIESVGTQASVDLTGIPSGAYTVLVAHQTKRSTLRVLLRK